MGQHKLNKRAMLHDAAVDLTKDLTDRGKLVEAGFAAFAKFVIPKDAPAIQLSEMRLAFMAGAEHVFSSIMAILDEGADPTDADLRRMDLIHRELDEWRGKLSERVDPAKGTA